MKFIKSFFNPVLSNKALTSRELLFSLHKNFVEQHDFNPASNQTEISPFEADQINRPIIFKENEECAMFISKPCTDADERDSIKFIVSGGKTVSSAVEDVQKTPEFCECSAKGKKIEMFLPLGITKMGRGHWVLTHISLDPRNKKGEIDIIDSMGSTLFYPYDVVLTNINEALITTTEPEEFEGGLITDAYKLISKTTVRGDQGPFDHTSCGHFVIQYLTEFTNQFNLAVLPDIALAKQLPPSSSKDSIASASTAELSIDEMDEEMVRTPSSSEDSLENETFAQKVRQNNVHTKGTVRR